MTWGEVSPKQRQWFWGTGWVVQEVSIEIWLSSQSSNHEPDCILDTFDQKFHSESDACIQSQFRHHFRAYFWRILQPGPWLLEGRPLRQRERWKMSEGAWLQDLTHPSFDLIQLLNILPTTNQIFSPLVLGYIAHFICRILCWILSCE